MVAEVMRITNGHGARVAFDPVGGPDFPKLIAALANQGIAYIYGALSEDDTPIPVLEMIRRCYGQGVQHPAVTGDEARRKVAVEYVTRPCGARSGRSSIVYSSSTIWWKCTAIWRTAANSQDRCHALSDQETKRRGRRAPVLNAAAGGAHRCSLGIFVTSGQLRSSTSRFRQLEVPCMRVRRGELT